MHENEPPTTSTGQPQAWSEKSYEQRKFSGLSCQDVELDDIEFFDCRFDGCQFLRSGFRGCRFEQCVFERCDLSLLRVTDSRFVDVRFLKTKMLGIDWTAAAAADARLPGKQRQPFRLRGTQPAENGNDPMHGQGSGLHARQPDAGRPHRQRSPGEPIRRDEPELRRPFPGDELFHPPHAEPAQKTVFTLPEALSLLSALDIVLK